MPILRSIISFIIIEKYHFIYNPICHASLGIRCYPLRLCIEKSAWVACLIRDCVQKGLWVHWSGSMHEGEGVCGA